LESLLIACRKDRIKVVISELDIDVVPRSRWWADGGKYREEMSKTDPYKDGCPEDVLKRQAEQYAKLFQLFNKHSDVILRVSFWNLYDGESWLNYFPWNRTNHPLLFDRNGHPKPAFQSVINTWKTK
jgi:endo-1,4-beta-xylanase